MIVEIESNFVLNPSQEISQKKASFIKQIHDSLVSFLVTNKYFILYYISLFIITCILTYYSSFANPEALSLDCYANLDSKIPFKNTLTTLIKCPSQCLYSKTRAPFYFANTRPNYIPLVIGSNPYRGDSWVCTSAIHAGLVSNLVGGIVIATISNTNSTFNSSVSNGISSLSFDAIYPTTLTLSKPDFSYSPDLTIPALFIYLLFISVFMLLRPSVSLFCFNLYSIMFYFWAFISAYTAPHSNQQLQESSALIVPYFSTMFLIYSLSSNILIKTVDWKIIPGYVVPVILGYHLEAITSIIPLPNLSFTREMFSRTDTTILLVFIFIAVIAISIYLIYTHYKEGGKQRILKIASSYSVFGIFFFSLPPILNLRIHLHHTIYPLILLPLTRIKNIPSLVFHGVLIGIFSQGVINWDFGTPIETNLQYQKSTNSLIGSPKPVFKNNKTDLEWSVFIENNTISRIGMYPQDSFGISSWMLYVNDVLVYNGRENRYNWTGGVGYFRVAPVSSVFNGARWDVERLDFSDVLRCDFSGCISYAVT